MTEHQYPPPTPRFPPRGLSSGQFSEPYTPAELRMISYVNSVVRGSDQPGAELSEAIERLRIDAAYFTFRDRKRERAELDDCEQNGPKPIAPVAPATEGLPLCKTQPPSNHCGSPVGASACDCGGG